jgi:hypothetical protein
MKTNLQGVFQDITNEAYHSGPGLSSSGVIRLKQSPSHYWEYKNNPPTQTTAMKLGTAFHTLILEPESFRKNYAILKDFGDCRKVENKAAKAAFIAENENKLLLTQEEHENLLKMESALRSHKLAARLLTGGKAEQSVFWTDNETQVLCKCRPDFLRSDGIVIDLKTSDDASLPQFQKSISKFQYHIQSAFYLDGISQALNEPLTDFIHVVVEKNPPYGVGIYTLDDGSLNKAREEIRDLLKLFSECLNKNQWPGYIEEIQNISIPAWMF